MILSNYNNKQSPHNRIEDKTEKFSLGKIWKYTASTTMNNL